LEQRTGFWHFRVAAAFSLLLACLAGSFLAFWGKNDSFLIINHYNHPAADTFFRSWTYLGDGLIWIPLLVYVLRYKRDFLWAVILAFLISTLLTQFSKWVIFPDALRPYGILKEQVHLVQGVEPHLTSSFPSGHTTSAFTYALLLAFLLRRLYWTFLFPLVAFFVGYSRVYLAQHFITDVTAGIIVGMASVLLSLLFYEKIRDRKLRTAATVSPDETGGLN
jgi:membrane-associated phospholipid phosphatase